MSDRNCCPQCGSHYSDGCNRSCEELAEVEARVDALHRLIYIYRAAIITHRDQTDRDDAQLYGVLNEVESLYE